MTLTLAVFFFFPQEDPVDVRQLADGLKALVEKGLSRAAAVLARVLPHLAHGCTPAQEALLDHFAFALDLSALDAAAARDGDAALQVRIATHMSIGFSMPYHPFWVRWLMLRRVFLLYSPAISGCLLVSSLWKDPLVSDNSGCTRMGAEIFSATSIDALLETQFLPGVW